MKKNYVYRDKILWERKFHSPKDTDDSERYYDVKGFALYTCPKTGRRWASAQSWGIIDLKKEEICYDFPQYCNKCEGKANPEFTEESIERMAEYAVRQHLIKKRKEIHAVFKPRGDDDRHETKGPHDEKRCGKCRALRRNCMGK